MNNIEHLADNYRKMTPFTTYVLLSFSKPCKDSVVMYIEETAFLEINSFISKCDLSSRTQGG